MNNKDIVLAFDIGTGSARAALVDRIGHFHAISAVAHPTQYPDHGHAEQSPEAWWRGLCQATQEVVKAADRSGLRIVGICGCGQMHAPVLLDRDGALLTKQVQLWNDKRAEGIVDALTRSSDHAQLSKTAANPAATSWPAAKLMWIAEHEPETLDKADVVLMPKDYVNFRLCGEVGQDRTEAGSSWLFDPETAGWSSKLAQSLGLTTTILPEIRNCCATLGRLSATAAHETGLPVGIPVFVGGGDYPVSVLGSGAHRPQDASDVTGTSSLLSILTPEPVRAAKVMNAATPTDGWKAFCVVDAAGDAIRWGRRELEADAIGFDELTRMARSVAPGADGLIFLPYLTGERLGNGRASRAAFLGLTAAHGKPHLHRAILEGTALALFAAADALITHCGLPDRVIAAGGGARSEVLLRIKASVFGVPFSPVANTECGLMGAATLAMAGLGVFADPHSAVDRLVRHLPPVLPDPVTTGYYQELAAIFSDARRAILDTSTRLSALSQ